MPNYDSIKVSQAYAWRVQDKNGRGPYNAAYGWQEDEHTLQTGRPGPPNDPGLREYFVNIQSDVEKSGRELVFGFVTVDQLHAWFRHDELEVLFEQGFTVHKIKVTDIWSSDYQAVFVPAT